MPYLHFSVTGEFLTETARNFLLEGNWSSAFSLLSEILIGISCDQVLSILQAETKLTKDSTVGISIEDEDSNVRDRYLEEVNSVYSFIVKYSNGGFNWWKPYAIVTNCDNLDANLDSLGLDDSRGFPIGNYRTLHNWKGPINKGSRIDNRYGFPIDNRCGRYTDNDCDLVYYTGCIAERSSELPKEFIDAIAILFKPCQEPPFWMQKNTQFKECLENFAKFGFVERRGDGPCQSNAANAVLKAISNKFESLASDAESIDDIVDKINYNDFDYSILPDKNQKEMCLINKTVMNSLSSMDWESKPEEDKYFENNIGWILKDGRFFGCKYMHHKSLAFRIFTKILNMSEEDMTQDFEIKAENMGWVKIQTSLIFNNNEPTFYMGMMKKPTQRQLDTIHDFCQKHKVNFPEQFLESDK